MNDKLKPGQDPRSVAAAAQKDSVQTPADQTVFRSTRAESVTPQANSNTSHSKAAADSTRVKTAQANNTRMKPTPARSQVQPPADATRMRNQHSAAPAHKDATRTRIRPSAGTQGAAVTARVDPGGQDKQVLKGRFVLDKVIGVGGMGIVYKATDKLKVEAHDREPFVAIKVLSEEFKSHPESFIALQRESRKTQRIAHPNVVKVYDFDRDGDIVFMTMEYMEGRPLDQIIKQYSATGLPRDDVWTILNGLCSALIHAHEEKIVHSDFKPGNIFITDSGQAKIFDFGIARAVANVDRQSGRIEDRTVFDAGSLGALTPAYASLEMLQGQEPDVRDDIYALGCIAYEMLAGTHPYNRIPADEAFKNRLRPARITGIRARQWKAIEKALAFRRDDRLASVEDFYQLIQPKTRSIMLWSVVFLSVSAIGFAAYVALNNTRQPVQESTIQLDEIEFKIRYDLFREKIGKLIAEPRFTTDWENALWDEVQGLTLLLGNKQDAWLKDARGRILEMYLAKYSELLEAGSYTRAGTVLENAYRYADDRIPLDREKQRLAQLARDAAARASVVEAEKQRIKESGAAQQREEQERDRLFELAMRNVSQQLQCQGRLNMRDFGVAVEKLRATNQARYRELEGNIILKLSECITQMGKTQPERAIEAKNYALRIFDNHRMIAAINITPRDACDRSIAGLGARGDRALCRDKQPGGMSGPALIVTPEHPSFPAFAISKYEISIKEFNHYCSASGDCTMQAATDDGLPVVNISIAMVEGYLKWLSRTTQQKYRLPTRAEWVYAANASSQTHDPNRNCQLNSRGIEKGGKLVRANAGVQNGWGLVNYLGNAQEWVYDKSRNLLAIGGSFEDAMDRCDVTTSVRHSGNPDQKTGFRVVRELAR